MFPAARSVSAPDGTLTPFAEAKEQAVAEFELRYARTALALAGGNISKAARLSGKHRRAFWELVRRYQIQVPRPGVEEASDEPDEV